MNIFFSDSDPVIAAQNLDDKRVVKMILESAQMLCCALHLNQASHLAKYKLTHSNHPSNLWARATDANYDWLLQHFKALCDEYTHRYGKIHATANMYSDLCAGKAFVPRGPLTPFANCATRSDLGIDCKHISDTVTAYKFYLMQRWLRDSNPKWTKREQPVFLQTTVAIAVTISKLKLERNNVQPNTNAA